MKVRIALATIVAALAVGAVATAAVGHTSLVSSSPAPGAAVESPETVSLTFDEALLQLGDDLVVRGDDGVDHVAGEPYFPRPDTIQADIDGVLPPGAYTIAWRIVAEDGHPIQGTIPFTVVGADGSGPTVAPATPTLTNASATGGGVSVGVIVAACVGIALLLALGFFLLRPKDAATGSRRRPTRE